MTFGVLFQPLSKYITSCGYDTYHKKCITDECQVHIKDEHTKLANVLFHLKTERDTGKCKDKLMSLKAGFSNIATVAYHQNKQ